MWVTSTTSGGLLRDDAPATIEFGLLVRQSMLQRLRLVTLELLPRFGARQLKAQLRELETIANHPADAQATMEGERQMMQSSIRMIVADPSLLGIPDEAPDIMPSLERLMEVPELTPALKDFFGKLMHAAPAEVQKDPVALLKYLTDAEPQAPAEQREAYHMILVAFGAAVKPASTSLSAIAKSLTPEEKAHAEKIIRIYCDPRPRSFAEAFRRPEKEWGLEFKPQSQDDGNAQVMKDGREGRFADVDFYALRLADTINKLSGDDEPIDLCRSVMLDREKARIAVVDAKIWSYRLVHHRLPSNLKEIGNPVDPLSGRPYLYRRTSAKSFDLAAVGIPGVGRIDAETKSPLRSH